jgi:alkaline phosphatase D
MYRIIVALNLMLASVGIPISASDKVRIAFGSCAKQYEPQPIWDAILESQPDLFLFIGDIVYADTTDPNLLRQAFDRLDQIEGFGKLRNSCPVYAVWDDHDYGLNDGGAEHPRKREAQRVFLDFLRVPEESQLRKQEGVYQSLMIGEPGKRVQVILLDTRYHRGPLKSISIRNRTLYMPSLNKSASMLGDQQWQWLRRQLEEPAEVRILVSSIQVIPDIHPFEKWANLPHERSRLLEAIAPSNGVVILSGDQHFAEVSRLPRKDRYDLLEFTSSGMTHHRGIIAAPNNHRVGQEVVAKNFGQIDIDWTLSDPKIVFSAKSVSGEVLLQHELRLSQLQNEVGEAD